MTLRVLFFASLARRLGLTQATLKLSSGATVADAYRTLAAEHPALEPASRGLAFAVNMAYVGPDHELRDGDELALIPPVSGG